jgi:tRNA-splicing ligase RtcB (3'-phosphate/5'-hydroxy nucleic acid ligase)
MMSFRSTVAMEKGYDDRLRKKFSEEVMSRIGIGVGKKGHFSFSGKEFQEIIRRGAAALSYERGNSERDFIPVDDTWDPPKQAVDRGIGQLGSLGGGNHFIELQHDESGHLWVMVHTGSRGFGHALATHFIRSGKEQLQKQGLPLRGGAEAVYFLPDSPLYVGYRNAVAAGGNFAIANRLLIWQGVGTAFRRVFGQEPELVYEISHNLVQQETMPDGRTAWIHRKGATRAFPAGHPMLAGTKWEKTGHPVLIPGSMGDQSFILMPKAGAAKSLFSVNHGCGRRMSRSAAKNSLTQSGVNKQMKQLNVMVNGGGDVPIDESPGVYKPSKDVIAAVVDAGLAEVAHTLTPIASIKGED